VNSIAFMSCAILALGCTIVPARAEIMPPGGPRICVTADDGETVTLADVTIHGSGRFANTDLDPQAAIAPRVFVEDWHMSWADEQLSAWNEAPLSTARQTSGADEAIRLSYLPAHQTGGWFIRLSRYGDGRIDYVFKGIGRTTGYQLPGEQRHEYAGTISPEDTPGLVRLLDAVGTLKDAPPSSVDGQCFDGFIGVLEYSGPGAEVRVSRDSCDRAEGDPVLVLMGFLEEVARKTLAPERQPTGMADPQIGLWLGR
jgi:hypothetical protein